MSRPRSRQPSISGSEDSTSLLSDLVHDEFRDSLPHFSKRMFSIDRARFYADMTDLKVPMYAAANNSTQYPQLTKLLKKIGKNKKAQSKGKAKLSDKDYAMSGLGELIKTALSNIPDYELEMPPQDAEKAIKERLCFAMVCEAQKAGGRISAVERLALEQEANRMLDQLFVDRDVYQIIKKTVSKGIGERKDKLDAFHQTVDRVLVANDSERKDVGNYNRDIRDLRKLLRRGQLQNRDDEDKMQAIAQRSIERATSAQALVAPLKSQHAQLKNKLEKAGHLDVTADHISAALNLDSVISDKLSREELDKIISDVCHSDPAEVQQAKTKLAAALDILDPDKGKMKAGTELRDLDPDQINAIRDAVQVMHRVMNVLRGQDERDDNYKQILDTIIMMESYLNHADKNNGFQVEPLEKRDEVRQQVADLAVLIDFYEDKVKLNMQMASMVDMRMMSLRLPKHESVDQEAVADLERRQKGLREELELISGEGADLETLQTRLSGLPNSTSWRFLFDSNEALFSSEESVDDSVAKFKSASSSETDEVDKEQVDEQVLYIPPPPFAEMKRENVAARKVGNILDSSSESTQSSFSPSSQRSGSSKVSDLGASKLLRDSGDSSGSLSERKSSSQSASDVEKEEVKSDSKRGRRRVRVRRSRSDSKSHSSSSHHSSSRSRSSDAPGLSSRSRKEYEERRASRSSSSSSSRSSHKSGASQESSSKKSSLSKTSLVGSRISFFNSLSDSPSSQSSSQSRQLDKEAKPQPQERADKGLAEALLKNNRDPKDPANIDATVTKVDKKGRHAGIKHTHEEVLQDARDALKKPSGPGRR